MTDFTAKFAAFKIISAAKKGGTIAQLARAGRVRPTRRDTSGVSLEESRALVRRLLAEGAI